MKKHTTLILGAAGLIGSELAKQLQEAGHDLFLFDMRPIDQEFGFHIRQSIFDARMLGQTIQTIKPSLIINCINIATITSSGGERGYRRLINFYLELYKNLLSLEGPVHYLQMGTTGSGGLGFNIPFTHGDTLENLPIINKSAFAGVGTAMLTLLSRSFSDNRVRVSEIKPGLAIFSQGYTEEKTRRAQLVTVNGGESGLYTYAELALLMSYMGYTTVQDIAAAALDVISGKQVKKELSAADIIEATNQAIIAPSESGQKVCNDLLRKMQMSQGKTHIIATGNLGPPSITRDLLLASLLVQGTVPATRPEFIEALASDASIQATLDYIHDQNLGLWRYLRKACDYSSFEVLRKHQTAKTTEGWQIVKDKLDTQQAAKQALNIQQHITR